MKLPVIYFQYFTCNTKQNVINNYISKNKCINIYSHQLTKTIIPHIYILNCHMVGEKFYVIRLYIRSFYRSVVGNIYDVSFTVKS